MVIGVVESPFMIGSAGHRCRRVLDIDCTNRSGIRPSAMEARRSRHAATGPREIDNARTVSRHKR